MRELSMEKLAKVNGGKCIKEAYIALRDLVNNHLGDFVDGIKAGWSSK